MRFLWICTKYLLWSLFSIIVFLLLIGVAKTNWSVSWYVHFLNTNDWSEFHRSELSTRADPFWPITSDADSIEDVLSDDTIETGLDALDVYDPSFEKELNTLSDENILLEDEDFGFTSNK